MKKNAENLYDLLNNLLEWARVQRGIISFEPAPLDLDEIVRVSLELIEPGATQKDISLGVSIPQGIRIFGDRAMLCTVIRNILSNAVKYTRRKGQIRVMAECRESMVVVAVKDTGLGMDEQTVSRLFTQAHKLSMKGTEGETGTGLGLILCKEFVEKHGGRIWAESKPGKGATFFFTLPGCR